MRTGQWHAAQKEGSPLIAPKNSMIIPVDWLHVDILLLFTDKQRMLVASQFRADEAAQYFGQQPRMFDGMASVLYTDGSVPYFILFIPYEERRIIIHECTHITHMIFELMGIPVETNNTEVIAYMTDFVCDKVFDAFDQRTLHKSKKEALT
jgi:hypothetical protein